MCMCSFGGAAVLQTYDPAKSQMKKFSFVPGQGLKVVYEGAAPSEARRPGNKFWVAGSESPQVQSALTSVTAAASNKG